MPRGAASRALPCWTAAARRIRCPPPRAWRRACRRAGCRGGRRRNSAQGRAAPGCRWSGLRDRLGAPQRHLGFRSRSMKRPVAWPIWPSTSRMPPMPVSRRARLGCSSGVALICCRMSGEALSKAQSWPSSALTQIDDCARRGTDAAVAQAGAIAAVAVPLREAATCGGTEDDQFHD